MTVLRQSPETHQHQHQHPKTPTHQMPSSATVQISCTRCIRQVGEDEGALVNRNSSLSRLVTTHHLTPYLSHGSHQVRPKQPRPIRVLQVIIVYMLWI